MTEPKNRIESMIDGASIILSTEHLEKLKNDLARQIFKPDVLAKRYGFRDEVALRSYLLANPWVVVEAKALKAHFDSGQATAERIEIKSQTAYEDGVIPAMYAIATNPAVAPRDRIEAGKEMRLAGRIGVTAKDGSAIAGTQFSLTINMPDGRSETIATTVVEQLPPSEDEAPAA
jgi:uncharacterized protein YbjT (DUF2867 family)